MLRKIILFLAIATLYCNQATANNAFFYKFTAKAATTGEGKVYVSNKDEAPADNRYFDYYGTSTLSESLELNVSAITVTAFLFARPENGYLFTHWARVEEDGTETVFSRLKNATDIATIMSQDKTKPDVINFKAYFAKKGQIVPASSDEALGTVDIDIPTNVNGDEVTLTAFTDIFNGIFKGWQRNSSTRLIEDNPLKLTTTDATRGTYTAVYEPRGIDSKGIYVMLECIGTNQYLGVKGNSESTIDTDQRYFKHSMFLVNSSNSHIHSLPGLVIKLQGSSTGTGGLKDVEMKAQGVSTFDISGQTFRIEKYKENDYFIFGISNGFSGYIKDNGGATSSMELVGTIHNPSLWNRPNDSERYRWRVHVIAEDSFDENYFGAEPSSKTTQDGKYYTTMYTTFPYECRDGVKAYIVDKILPNGKAHLLEIPEGTVPSKTPVILECNATTAKGNRLMPLLEEPLPVTTYNLLKGELGLDDETGEENYRTAFDPNTMRVLSTNKAVFANVNNTDPTNKNKRLKYIASNTCYLDVSEVEGPANNIEFTKDGDFSELLGDANGDRVVNVTDAALCVDYILHKKVKMFFFKNADINKDDKIDVVDVMMIVDIVLHKN